eukprot:CAMPEP_0202104628 /NCGR_PEP_ID=MMETSP0965-20130614/5577_1 /ASSEMBLY_ACC=CAM_ASM_000507 /TAXON_ID=4773 /ORGANISM="Schizochytrium aggregatum, Strain ATCC28209" /LENGTH=84 /DNA_ID=CAMNT_0048673495 /DNA_START=197 /DNA_END=448 /DNA_ORIENTATION=+
MNSHSALAPPLNPARCSISSSDRTIAVWACTGSLVVAVVVVAAAATRLHLTVAAAVAAGDKAEAAAAAAADCAKTDGTAVGQCR